MSPTLQTVFIVLVLAALAGGCEFLDGAGLGDVFGADAADTEDAGGPDAADPRGTDAVVVGPPNTPSTPSSPSDPGAPPPATSPSGACGMPGEAVAVLDWTNLARADAGLAPLRCDAALADAAWAHSDDMCRRDYFDHESPEGEGPWDRAERAGATFQWVGENIAWGYVDAAEVHEGWMTSPGHRANILGDYGRLGVGRVDCGGGPVWTQVFAD